MDGKRILLTAFQRTSAELLVNNARVRRQYMVLILPNDKAKDSELLIEALQQEQFDYVISFGQRPNIKDKVHIETTARKDEWCIDTTFDCAALKQGVEQSGLSVKISHNAGTSFCNELYWNGLQYLKDKKTDTQMVFVHVPFKKNISELDGFGEKLFAGLEGALKEEKG